MERGKLEMELEEERKSRNQWISEQRMKIENSSTASFSVSDCGTNDNQVHFLRNEIIGPDKACKCLIFSKIVGSLQNFVIYLVYLDPYVCMCVVIFVFLDNS
jgi:hypothetical protein